MVIFNWSNVFLYFKLMILLLQNTVYSYFQWILFTEILRTLKVDILYLIICNVHLKMTSQQCASNGTLPNHGARVISRKSDLNPGVFLSSSHSTYCLNVHHPTGWYDPSTLNNIPLGTHYSTIYILFRFTWLISLLSESWALDPWLCIFMF